MAAVTSESMHSGSVTEESDRGDVQVETSDALAANGTGSDPYEYDSLTGIGQIQNRIEELESATATLMIDTSERDIIDSIRKANYEMTQLIRTQGDQSEKLSVLHRRYMDLFHDMKRLEKDHALMKKREEALLKEKSVVSSDMTRTLDMKNKLESLCRELQRENKRIKEEGRLMILKEQQKREELGLRFGNTLWEIRSRSDRDALERDADYSSDVTAWRDKMRGFMEQYDLREKHFNCVMRSKDLELQLYEAKYLQQRQMADEQSSKALSLRNQVTTFVRTESELRKQLGVYVEKFRQVEETLNKSNELFSTFRREMEQMTKKTKRLEKENSTLRVKTDTMNRNILEMAEECNRAQKLLNTSEKKRQKLEDLCRALQAERNTLKLKIESTDNATPNNSGKETKLPNGTSAPATAATATTAPAIPAATRARGATK